MGMTYRARHVGDDEVVAIKELSFSRLDTFKKQELFEREARILRELEHPGVPTYYDELVWGIGKHQAFYIVEEFIDGQTLASEFESRRYSEEEVLDVVEELSQILEYLHTRAPAVIHRDLKPDNIMRRSSGEIVIVDFGVVGDGVHDSSAGATVAGTFGYMAPEQLRGVSTRASDLYALGALALEMLTRTPPHEMVTTQGALAWRARVEGSASRGVIELLEELLEPDHRVRIERAADVRARRARAQGRDVGERCVGESPGVEADRDLSPIGRARELVRGRDRARRVRVDGATLRGGVLRHNSGGDRGVGDFTARAVRDPILTRVGRGRRGACQVGRREA